MLPPARHGADLGSEGLRVHIIGHDHVFHIYCGYGFGLIIVGAYRVNKVTQQGFHILSRAFAHEAGHHINHARLQPCGHL